MIHHLPALAREDQVTKSYNKINNLHNPQRISWSLVFKHLHLTLYSTINLNHLDADGKRMNFFNVYQI